MVEAVAPAAEERAWGEGRGGGGAGGWLIVGETIPRVGGDFRAACRSLDQAVRGRLQWRDRRGLHGHARAIRSHAATAM